MNSSEIIKKIDYSLEILYNIKKRKYNIKKRKYNINLEKSRNNTDQKLKELFDFIENK